MSGRLKAQGTIGLAERLFEASSRKAPPRLLEENPYHSGWRPSVGAV
jgi:hypothetical protein